MAWGDVSDGRVCWKSSVASGGAWRDLSAASVVVRCSVQGKLRDISYYSFQTTRDLLEFQLVLPFYWRSTVASLVLQICLSISQDVQIL